MSASRSRGSTKVRCKQDFHNIRSSAIPAPAGSYSLAIGDPTIWPTVRGWPSTLDCDITYKQREDLARLFAPEPPDPRMNRSSPLPSSDLTATQIA